MSIFDQLNNRLTELRAQGVDILFELLNTSYGWTATANAYKPGRGRKTTLCKTSQHQSAESACEHFIDELAKLDMQPYINPKRRSI